jgi:hypothetical protein
MQFVLMGFDEIPGFRVFAYEGVAADRSRVQFSVKADLAMARKYGIRAQEFPLLCRALLDQRHEEGGAKRNFVFSEDDMRIFAQSAAARTEAAQRRKPPRRPVSDQVGNAWRVSPPLSGPRP